MGEIEHARNEIVFLGSDETLFGELSSAAAGQGLEVHRLALLVASGTASAVGNLGARLGRLLGLDADRLTAVVPTAGGARVVRLLGLVAVRALLQLRRRQREVGAAIALPGVRRASLGDSHE